MASNLISMEEWSKNAVNYKGENGEYANSAPLKKLMALQANVNSVFKKYGMNTGSWGPILIALKSDIRADLLPAILPLFPSTPSLNYLKSIYSAMTTSECSEYINMRLEACVSCARLYRSNPTEFDNVLAKTKQEEVDAVFTGKGDIVAWQDDVRILMAAYLPDYKAPLMTQGFKKGTNEEFETMVNHCKNILIVTIKLGYDTKYVIPKGTNILDKDDEVVKTYRTAQKNCNAFFSEKRKILNKRGGSSGPVRGDQIIFDEDIAIQVEGTNLKADRKKDYNRGRQFHFNSENLA
jgi:hypothetical protein